jgi:hypothetical protein
MVIGPNFPRSTALAPPSFALLLRRLSSHARVCQSTVSTTRLAVWWHRVAPRTVVHLLLPWPLPRSTARPPVLPVPRIYLCPTGPPSTLSPSDDAYQSPAFSPHLSSNHCRPPLVITAVVLDSSRWSTCSAYCLATSCSKMSWYPELDSDGRFDSVTDFLRSQPHTTQDDFEGSQNIAASSDIDPWSQFNPRVCIT